MLNKILKITVSCFMALSFSVGMCMALLGYNIDVIVICFGFFIVFVVQYITLSNYTNDLEERLS